MLQRIQTALIVALVIAVAVMGYDSFRMRRETSEAMRELTAGMQALSARLTPQETGVDANEGEALAVPGSLGAAERDGVREAVGAEAPESLLTDRMGRPLLAADRDVATWRARFLEQPDDWRHGLAVAARIAELPPELALEMMSGVWPDLPVGHKEQVLKPFVFHGGHELALDFLQLAAADDAPSVRERAYAYLESYAFRNFDGDPAAYAAWAERWQGRPLDEVLVGSARELVERLNGLSFDELSREMELLEDLDLRAARKFDVDLDATFEEAGLLRMAENWILADEEGVTTQVLDWVDGLSPPSEWMQTQVMPLLDGATRAQLSEEDAGVMAAACRALGEPGYGFAREPLLEIVAQRGTGSGGDAYDGVAMAAVMSLAKIADPRDVPRMIGLIEADASGGQDYWVGYFGLRGMTGVSWDESHDGAWWRAWWEANRSGYAPEVAALEIPD